MISDQTIAAVRDMPSGTHAILVYDTLEHKHDVLLAHLGQGIGKEGLVYAYSGERPDAVRGEMLRRGFGLEYLTRRGELTIAPAEEIYMKGGRVDVDGIYRSFSNLAWGYRKRGLEGIRAAADMAPFIHKGMFRELELYEQSLGRRFAFPGKGICAYDVLELHNSGRLEELLPIFMAHAMVILTGPKGSYVRQPEEVKQVGLVQTLRPLVPRPTAGG